MDDWGEINLTQIEDGGDFWCLMEELWDDNSGFLHNRNVLVEAYKNGNLYGLYVSETDAMYERGARIDDIFCDKSWYLLPCFCIKEDNKAIIIWTHSRARKMGFAKKLAELLKIEVPADPLPGSV
uniref:Uncharacterized protein n=1 Tax=viral metagenome TaxID=1070528 RepID=A0A6C0LM89_9ZZZZ